MKDFKDLDWLQSVTNKHPNTLRRWCRDKKIPHRIFNGKYIFIESEINEWLTHHLPGVHIDDLLKPDKSIEALIQKSKNPVATNGFNQSEKR